MWPAWAAGQRLSRVALPSATARCPGTVAWRDSPLPVCRRGYVLCSTRQDFRDVEGKGGCPPRKPPKTLRLGPNPVAGPEPRHVATSPENVGQERLSPLSLSPVPAPAASQLVTGVRGTLPAPLPPRGPPNRPRLPSPSSRPKGPQARLLACPLGPVEVLCSVGLCPGAAGDSGGVSPEAGRGHDGAGSSPRRSRDSAAPQAEPLADSPHRRTQRGPVPGPELPELAGARPPATGLLLLLRPRLSSWQGLAGRPSLGPGGSDD